MDKRNLKVWVRVPASSANLGPGFDVAGMALELYNYIQVEETFSPESTGLSMELEGEGAHVLSVNPEYNMICKAMMKAFESYGYTPGNLKIKSRNQIPISRGLGSSASAIIGGIVAASALVTARQGSGPDTNQILKLAVEIEGHRDNIYPALLGGLVISAPETQSLTCPPYLKLPVPYTIRLLAVVPDYHVATNDARQVIPSEYSRADTVFNLGRLGLLVGSLLINDDSVLLQAMEDKLHQPYRQKLIPGMEQAMLKAKKLGVKGVFLSGSGPTLMAFVDEGPCRLSVAKGMIKAFADEGIQARAIDVRPDVYGARASCSIGNGNSKSGFWDIRGYPGLTRPRLVVQKYGGSSLANPECLKNVASRVKKCWEDGNDVVVIVSAMGDTTDKLFKLAGAVTDNPQEREMDMLLSTGEQISIALLSMAVQSLGCPAVSFTGSQVSILTDQAHTKAKVVGVGRETILAHLEKREVVIVAGFQGKSPTGEITTLGRGGSDTTAVAIAAALDADSCEIYTDVNGVYTADPKAVPKAVKLKEISYDEMSEMANLGAKVMQLRAVEFAKRYGVKLKVKSSFCDDEGTIIQGVDQLMEQVLIRGITHSVDEVKLVIEGVPDVPGVAAKLFTALSSKRIRADMILQSMRKDNRNDIAFTVNREDSRAALEVTNEIACEIGALKVILEDDIAKVSVVGAGISQDVSVAADVFGALAEEGINIDMISTSGIRISCVISKGRVYDAVRALHSRFADKLPG